MATTKKRKKNLIVSYKNLTEDLKEKLKEAYPDGYNNYLQRFTKPNGETIFVVPFETVDTCYMVKFEVVIDTLGEDLDKALFDDDDDSGKEDEFAPLSEALEKEAPPSATTMWKNSTATRKSATMTTNPATTISSPPTKISAASRKNTSRPRIPLSTLPSPKKRWPPSPSLKNVDAKRKKNNKLNRAYI